jgi:hypothetical protein
MRDQHSAAIRCTVDHLSAAGHNAEQRLDYVRTRLIVIAGEELNSCAALAPRINFGDYSLLRFVEPPRSTDIPRVYYVTNQI